MGRVFVLAFTAALNPSLLAAVTVMLALDRPRRLLVGYLMGAALTSVTCCLVLVFALHGSSTAGTAKHTINPVFDIVVGALFLVVVFVVGTGRDTRRRARSERKREEAQHKEDPRWKRVLSKGSARDTFVVGILLTFPGASTIAGMNLLSKQDIGRVATVATVLAFNLIMLLLLELPLLGYTFRPEWTAATIARFSAWLSRRGGRIALICVGVLGAVLVARGTLQLVD